MEDPIPKKERPFKIDFHTHILPKEYPDLNARYGCGGWITLEHHKPGRANMMLDGKFFREIESNCWCATKRAEECDATDVDVQVLSTVPVMFSYWAKPEHCADLSRILNDDLAEVVRSNPKRFVGLGTLPMQAPELAVEELRRCMKELGLAGVQIGTHINEWNLDAPELFPVFEEAERLGAVVFVHPWDMMAKERMARYWASWLVGMPAETTLAIWSMIAGGVLEKLPKLKLVFAHGGGTFAQTLGRIERGWEVRPDLVRIRNEKSPLNYLGRIWVDSLTHDEHMLQHIVRVFGADRVVVGSDYPFPLGEDRAGEGVEKSELDEETKRKILSGNALALLGKTEADFK